MRNIFKEVIKTKVEFTRKDIYALEAFKKSFKEVCDKQLFCNDCPYHDFCTEYKCPPDVIFNNLIDNIYYNDNTIIVENQEQNDEEALCDYCALYNKCTKEPNFDAPPCPSFNKNDTVWYVHFFREQDIYYNDMIFKDSDDAFTYFHNCYNNHVNSEIEEGYIDQEKADEIWVEAINKCNDLDYYPMVEDFYVDMYIPQFGYIREMGVR